MKNKFAVLAYDGVNGLRLGSSTPFETQAKAERYAASAQATFIRKNDAELKRGGYYAEPPSYFVVEVVSVISLPIPPVETIKPDEATIGLNGESN